MISIPKSGSSRRIKQCDQSTAIKTPKTINQCKFTFLKRNGRLPMWQDPGQCSFSEAGNDNGLQIQAYQSFSHYNIRKQITAIIKNVPYRSSSFSFFSNHPLTFHEFSLSSAHSIGAQLPTDRRNAAQVHQHFPVMQTGGQLKTVFYCGMMSPFFIKLI